MKKIFAIVVSLGMVVGMCIGAIQMIASLI